MVDIGIDLGGKHSQVCVRDGSGATVNLRVETRRLVEVVRQQEGGRVVMEACSPAFHLARQLKAEKREVVVVPSTLSRQLGVGSRGVKTDAKDAQVLAMVSARLEQLPNVHVPSVAAQEMRQRLTVRENLVAVRTQMVNVVKGYLRTRVLTVRATPKTLADKVEELLLGEPEGVPDFLSGPLALLREADRQVQAADKALAELVATLPVCRLLMTAPGVGPLTAAYFYSAVDDVSRFEDGHRVASYLGLTPRENSSGDRQRKGGISKAGNSALRKCLVQGAWTVMRAYPDDRMAVWAKRLAKEKRSTVAVCALARKLAGVLFAMWRDNKEYETRPTLEAVRP